MRGSPNPRHSAILNCAGADGWNRARKDGGTKVESGDVLERLDEMEEIEEGMPMKLGPLDIVPFELYRSSTNQ